MPETRFPHLVLTNPPENRSFTSTSSGGKEKHIPERENPKAHSEYLQNKLRQAWLEAENELVVHHVERTGIYLEFKGEPGHELVTKSLEDMRSKKIRLLNVRIEQEKIQVPDGNSEVTTAVTYATVYVAKDKVPLFTKKLHEYAQQTLASGKPRHADFVNSVADLSNALSVESFWTDSKSLRPTDQPKWCEVWLNSDAKPVIERFEQLLNQQNIEAKSSLLVFPERTVKVILANNDQLVELIRRSDDIAEFRLAKETATFWTEQPNREQADWAQNLLERIEIDHDTEISVCLLDTGVNNGHPLLTPLLSDADCLSVDETWGAHDHDRHGTLMAGIALYGDLAQCLISSAPVQLSHCLESVKILPPSDRNEPNLWGHITNQAISRAEIQAPHRRRAICMAVTATDTRDRGRPSSWSAELDQLASGADDGISRLLIVAAGNVSDLSTAWNYPAAQTTDSIHDPAQAWNALTVGAYTTLDKLTSPTFTGYQPIAPCNGLSPFTTTSLTWDDRWPVKPEIVMEGGNLAQDSTNFVSECDDLSLLSTFYKPQDSLFYPFNMTSAATAQAVWFAAKIQRTYPDFWPQTIRALMVHSARWPDTLLQQFGGDGSKTAMKQLLRISGYGVPDLERALYSASNSLTLVAQAELQPFDKTDDGRYKTKDMHLYELPWPTEVLLSLPDSVEVEMRVTLSYFVEPGPGEIGWQDRYRYASHGLRFDLNSPGESQDDFVKRINAAERDATKAHPGTQSASAHWVIGSQTRDKGSVHSDIWRGTAAELAQSNHIAIFPRIGWWRERSHLARWDRRTRYALIVSISTPEEHIDLYTPVAIKIGLVTPIVIDVTTAMSH